MAVCKDACNGIRWYSTRDVVTSVLHPSGHGACRHRLLSSTEQRPPCIQIDGTSFQVKLHYFPPPLSLSQPIKQNNSCAFSNKGILWLSTTLDARPFWLLRTPFLIVRQVRVSLDPCNSWKRATQRTHIPNSPLLSPPPNQSSKFLVSVFNLMKRALPEELKSRGFFEVTPGSPQDNLPGYHYRDDGLKIWQYCSPPPLFFRSSPTLTLPFSLAVLCVITYELC